MLDGTGLNYRVEDAATMVVGVQSKDTVSVTLRLQMGVDDEVYRAIAGYGAEYRRGAAVCDEGRSGDDVEGRIAERPGISRPRARQARKGTT